MNKILPLTIFFMLILCGMNGIANSTDRQNYIKVESESQSDLWLVVAWGVIRPGLRVRVYNRGSEVFDGNISGNISIDAPYMKYGNQTLFGPEYFHIEPSEYVIVNHTKFLGFGIADFVVYCDSPVDITLKFRTFIFLFWIWSFIFWEAET